MTENILEDDPGNRVEETDANSQIGGKKYSMLRQNVEMYSYAAKYCHRKNALKSLL